METLKIKPYARLLTMLGDELIKSERIAIVELVKNSYDAFASWVNVSFNNFGSDFQIESKSEIIIEDDGEGMSEDVIRKHFLNPATPEKKIRKSRQTAEEKSRRIMQGEKGIGRFAMFKLGGEIDIITRPKNSNIEYILRYDFSKYNSDFIDSNTNALFLDDLDVSFESRNPQEIVEKNIRFGEQNIIRKPYGTKIVIKALKGKFNQTTIDGICSDLGKMRPIFVKDDGKVGYNKSEFDVHIYKDGEPSYLFDKDMEHLSELINEQTVYQITGGMYLENQRRFIFNVNGRSDVIDFNDPYVRKNPIFKKYWNADLPLEQKAFTTCGDFKFSFYVFDFEDNALGKCYLSKDDKDLIRKHRVYLYRDGIRVYPYGDADDDWLQIDIMRGLVKAGQFLSNDQIIGQIDITQDGNPDLQDKTSREGIIENGTAFSDLIHLIQLFINFFKNNHYQKYLIDKKRNRGLIDIQKKKVESIFSHIKEELYSQPDLLDQVKELETSYLNERQVLEERLNVVESLAGVGLSVETASHDLMLMLQRLEDKVISISEEKSKSSISEDLTSILGMISFIKSKMKDIQILFTSSKQRTRAIDVEEILKKIINIYKAVLDKENITCKIIRINNTPLMVRTVDAVLMQLFINLIDNSCYWLDEYGTKERIINIYIDGMRNKLIFSDNGPGIKDDDVPYIFEAFYSRKGEDGRGLGLYIARRILERYDYSIELLTKQSEKKLPGANFLVDFNTEA